MSCVRGGGAGGGGAGGAGGGLAACRMPHGACRPHPAIMQHPSGRMPQDQWTSSQVLSFRGHAHMLPVPCRPPGGRGARG